MAFNVRFHFTGLCAFVPAKPIDQANNEATVVLVNATQSHHGPHHILCFADKQNTYKETGSNRQVDLVFTFNIDNANKLRVNGCRFSAEELTLIGRTAAGIEVPLDNTGGLNFDHDSLTDCPASVPASFRWVADMAKLRAGKIRSDALTTLGALVGMRMKLTQGRLYTSLFRQIRTPPPPPPPPGTVRWSFDGGSTFAPLAEEIVWDYSFRNVEVAELVVKSSAGASPLVLTPNADNLVEVWIVNMPLGQVLGFETANPLDSDDHFEEFFKLADGSPTPIIPKPDMIRSCPPFGAASNPKCPPAQFASLS